ncbi:putative uncharacterized protein [Eubacterium sp. CAG:786]|nr:putative uncharacterized protein [Eubacterium sp. CAG:786]
MDKVSKKGGSFMDTLASIFGNVWLKRGMAVLCWGYTGLLVWLAWLNFAYFLEYDNPTSLFVIYVFINVAALGLMIYTRHQVITQINVMIMPLILLVSFILAFGSWYMLLPPICVIVAMFFICRANETLKTVLGTMYLLMFVVGGAAYVAITLLMGRLTIFTGVDLTLRDANYEKLSSDEAYRIVRYVDKPNGERRTASYYVEDVSGDVDIPFGKAKKVLGCGWVLTTKYSGREDDPVSWVKTTIDGERVEALNVEGVIKENPYLAEEIIVQTTEESTVSIYSPASGTATDESTKETSGSAEPSTAEQ